MFLLTLLLLGRFIIGRSLREEDRLFTHLFFLLNHCIDKRRRFISWRCCLFTLASPQFLNTSWALIFRPVALKKASLGRGFLFRLVIRGWNILFRLNLFEEKLFSFVIVVIVKVVVSGKPDQYGASLESTQLINNSSDHSYSGFDLILSQKIIQ
jgi:hypothetical protein